MLDYITVIWIFGWVFSPHNIQVGFATPQFVFIPSSITFPLRVSFTLSTLKCQKHLLQRENIQVMSKQYPSQLTDYHLLQRAFDQVLALLVYT